MRGNYDSSTSPEGGKTSEEDNTPRSLVGILSPIEEHQIVMMLQSELMHSEASSKKAQRMTQSTVYRKLQLQQKQDRCREKTNEKMNRAMEKRGAISQSKNLHIAMVGSVIQSKQSDASYRLVEADRRLNEKQQRNREIIKQKQENSAQKRQLIIAARQLQLEQTRAQRLARAKAQADSNEQHNRELQESQRERTEERFKRTEASREKIATLNKHRDMTISSEISRTHELERQRLVERKRQEVEMQHKRAEEAKISHERKQLFDKMAHHIHKGTDPRRIAKMFSLNLPDPHLPKKRRPSTAVKHRPTPPPTPADQSEEIINDVSTTPGGGVRHWSRWVYD